MLYSELYKIMVNQVTFVGFMGSKSPSLEPPVSNFDKISHDSTEGLHITALATLQYQCYLLNQPETLILYQSFFFLFQDHTWKFRNIASFD